MANIENLSGKKMQIKFSPIYLKQGYKTDLDSGMDIETQTESIIDNVRYLSLGTEADTDKIEMCALIRGLGQVEFGPKGLEYINKILPTDVKQITEEELIRYNLNKIFKPDDASELFENFCEIYGLKSENKSLEKDILSIAIMVEKISQGVKQTISNSQTSQEPMVTGTMLKISELQKIKANYIKSKTIDLTPKLKELLPKINRLYQNYELSFERKAELDRLIENICDSQKTRDEILANVYNFSSGLNKKKSRGK